MCAVCPPNLKSFDRMLIVGMIDIRMENPQPTYGHLVTQLLNRFPDLAFIDLVEPGVQGNASEQPPPDEVPSNLPSSVSLSGSR